MKYSEIVQENRKLGHLLKSSPYSISVLSNITTQALHAPLEYSLRSNGVNASVKVGDFDNIVQNSCEQQDANAVIIFWEIINFQESISNNIEQCKSQIDFVFNNLKESPLVIFNRFSAESLSQHTRYIDFKKIADELNEYLQKYARSNRVFVDIEIIVKNISSQKSFNFRDYEAFFSLYSLDFYKNYISIISPIILAMNGHRKKVLISDCDNTLWNGIVGEDGLEGINIFSSLQEAILQLKRKGVVIGICSKNNSSDIETVFKEHSKMLIREEDLDVRRVNWNDKVSNLKEISEELNLGLDSFVYLDDSSYEVEFIKRNLPEVTVIQVSESSKDFSLLLYQLNYLFWSPSLTEEDQSRSSMLKAEKIRKDKKNKFQSITDYLKDLELELKIEVNPVAWIPRLSQLSMKTNQFNATSLRISENTLEDFYSRDDHRIYAFSAKDKYGDYGVTGLAIVEWKNSTAELKNFLMSCRTLGRDFEKAFFDFIISDLTALGIENLKCRYIHTNKNRIISNLFDDLGCKLESSTQIERSYNLKTAFYKASSLDYISVIP